MAKGKIIKTSATKSERENTQTMVSTLTNGHCLLPPTINTTHANSPCPHKETGQATGLPNRKGEMAMKINKQQGSCDEN